MSTEPSAGAVGKGIVTDHHAFVRGDTKPLAAQLEHRGFGLADDRVRRDSRAGDEGRGERSCFGDRLAIGPGMAAVGAGDVEPCAARHRLGGGRQLAVGEAPVARHQHHVAGGIVHLELQPAGIGAQRRAAEHHDAGARKIAGDGVEGAGAGKDHLVAIERDAQFGKAADQLLRRVLGVVGDDGEAPRQPRQQLACAGQQMPPAHQRSIQIDQIATCGMRILKQGKTLRLLPDSRLSLSQCQAS